MAKYISKNKLTQNRYITRLSFNPYTNKECEDIVGEREYVTYREIEDLPTIDIIFCKDCRHYKPVNDDMGKCLCYGLNDEKHRILTPVKEPNDFCSSGEEKENSAIISNDTENCEGV